MDPPTQPGDNVVAIALPEISAANRSKTSLSERRLPVNDQKKPSASSEDPSEDLVVALGNFVRAQSGLQSAEQQASVRQILVLFLFCINLALIYAIVGTLLQGPLFDYTKSVITGLFGGIFLAYLNQLKSRLLTLASKPAAAILIPALFLVLSGTLFVQRQSFFLLPINLEPSDASILINDKDVQTLGSPGDWLLPLPEIRDLNLKIQDGDNVGSYDLDRWEIAKGILSRFRLLSFLFGHHRLRLTPFYIVTLHFKGGGATVKVTTVQGDFPDQFLNHSTKTQKGYVRWHTIKKSTDVDHLYLPPGVYDFMLANKTRCAYLYHQNIGPQSESGNRIKFDDVSMEQCSGRVQ